MKARFGPPAGDIAFDLPCPSCGGELALRRSCLRVWVACADCGQRMGLEDLAPLLSDEAFERVAELLGERYADRL